MWWKNHPTKENESKYVICLFIAALGIVVHRIDGKRENDLILSIQSVFLEFFSFLYLNINYGTISFRFACDQCDIIWTFHSVAKCNTEHGTRDQHHFIESIKMFLVLLSRWICPSEKFVLLKFEFSLVQDAHRMFNHKILMVMFKGVRKLFLVFT